MTGDGNFLICVVKSNEQPFQDSINHLVIFSMLDDFCHVCNYVIPNSHKSWNYPQEGPSVFLMEEQQRIWTVINLEQGGFSMVLWSFDGS